MRTYLVLGFAVVLSLIARPVAAEKDVHEEDEKLLKTAKIETDGKSLMEFIRQRRVVAPDPKRIDELIRQLGDEDWEQREKATSDLVTIGAPARDKLAKAKNDKDPEIAYRAEQCHNMIDRGSDITLTNAALVSAAVRLLAVKRPEGAAPLLIEYLPQADHEGVAEDIRCTLARLCVNDGQPDQAFVKLLRDDDARKRATAGEALARAGMAGKAEGVAKLLEDADGTVRLRVGTALAFRKDKRALPVLIDLMGSLEPKQMWAAEDLLIRAAGESPPEVSLGTDEASRVKCRDAWKDWWKKNEEKVDLANIDKEPMLLGRHYVLLIDKGMLIELGSDNKPIWQLAGLQRPLDIQVLPSGNIVSAEQQAGRVTERTPKGEVVWKHDIEFPLVSQRLPNGNTFMISQTKMVEVDAKNKEVFTHAFDGDRIMRGRKLANGDIACILGSGKYVRLNDKLKEVASFQTQVDTSGGRIDVLPNGNVLIPHMYADMIVEYNPKGEKVREVRVQQPIVAHAQPNGNIITTSMNQQKALEIDRNGKTVWEYKGDTRVTRAFRR